MRSGSSRNSSRRVGRLQRRDTGPHLRQVPQRLRRDRRAQKRDCCGSSGSMPCRGRSHRVYELKLQVRIFMRCPYASTSGHGDQSSLAARVEGTPIADYLRFIAPRTASSGHAKISFFWRPTCWCNGGWSGRLVFPGRRSPSGAAKDAPMTTRPPPPPRNRPWICSVTWATGSAKAKHLNLVRWQHHPCWRYAVPVEQRRL
jgi:hypothetical protein